MSRALLVLWNDDMRNKAIRWIRGLPKDTRVEFKGPRRTLPQNDRMWAMLTDVSEQQEHFGRKYPPAIWKIIFLSALGRETVFVPNLDGTGLIPIGHSSSDLSVNEMSDLIECIFSWGATRGVTFHEPKSASVPIDERAA